MNMHKYILAIGSVAVLLTGCQNPDGTVNNTGTAAVMGGALGALTGAAVGGYRHGGQDALIGAAAGMVAGGLVGYSMDREQEARLKAQAPQTYAQVDQGQPLAVADVKAMAKAGVDEDVIISQITSSHTVFHLTSADIIDLRDAGVSDKVVNFMINTPNMAEAAPAAAPAPDVAPAPPAAPADATVVAPGPNYVWVGGEYVWTGGAWVWVGGHWMVPPHPHAVWVVGRSWHDAYGWHHARGYWR
jgi:outer membrane lipoprotein SlyB